MITKHFYDKTEWAYGVWQRECDYFAWIDSETEYPCVGRRNVLGAWCGFVGTDADHPLYMTLAKSDEMKFVEVHGTVSFTSFAPEDDIMFFPPQQRWWVGFDCMQDTDFCPAFKGEGEKRKRKLKDNLIYRDINFVKDQIEMLAAQLATYDSRIF